MTMEDQDELDGQALIRAEMAEKSLRAQRDHDYRMAKAGRAFITVATGIDVARIVFFTAVFIVAVLAALSS